MGVLYGTLVEIHIMLVLQLTLGYLPCMATLLSHLPPFKYPLFVSHKVSHLLAHWGGIKTGLGVLVCGLVLIDKHELHRRALSHIER